jgi:hypothetical protein
MYSMENGFFKIIAYLRTFVELFCGWLEKCSEKERRLFIEVIQNTLFDII